MYLSFSGDSGDRIKNGTVLFGRSLAESCNRFVKDLVNCVKEKELWIFHPVML